MSDDIFKKAALRPSQIRTVAERRYGDALYLRGSDENERANGVMYLAGFVIECLLKAKLLEKHSWLGTGRKKNPSEREQELWSLCFRSHDLDDLLDELPNVTERLAEAESKGHRGGLLTRLRRICSTWTIFARYSPKSATMKAAAEFLTHVKELKEWLK